MLFKYVNNNLRKPNKLESDVKLLDWIVEGDTCTLRHYTSKRSISVTPRGMDVLIYLIANPSKVVSANKLLELYWTKSARSDHAVHKVIAELRSALGDNAGEPRYIKTYPKRGYSLIAAPQLNYKVKALDAALRIAQVGKFIKWHALKISVFLALGLAAIFSVIDMFLQEESDGVTPKSLVVHPFNMVDVKRTDLYLSEQFPGMLVSRLSKLTNKNIISVQSSLIEHRVPDYTLTGSVQEFDGRYRVQVNLNDPHKKVILFSDQFNSDSELILDLQEEIVNQVASVFRHILDGNLRKDMLGWGTANPVAYDAFIKAEYYAKESNQEDFKFAIENYKLAIKQDRDFVNAYLGLATVATKMSLYGLHETNLEMLDLVNYSLREIIRLAPNSQSTKAAQILALRVQGDNQGLIEERLREMILDGDAPSFAMAHYSTLLSSSNLFYEARKYLEKIPSEHEYRVSPDATWNYRSYTETPESLIRIKKTELLERPNHLGVLGALARSYAFIGDAEQAKYYLARMLKLDKEGPFTMYAQVIVSALFGNSSSEGDAFEAARTDNPAFNFSWGVKQFIMGNVNGGIEKWNNLNRTETRLLFSWLSSAELFFPIEVLSDARYDKLLDSLGIGRSWQHTLMRGVSAMAIETGVVLSGQSREAYRKQRRLIRNNLWDQSNVINPKLALDISAGIESLSLSSNNN